MTGRFPDLARFLNNDEGVTTPEFVVLTAIVAIGSMLLITNVGSGAGDAAERFRAPLAPVPEIVTAP